MAEGSGIRAGKTFVELLLSDVKFNKALDAAARKLNAFGDRVTAIGKAALGAGAAITAPLLVAAQRFAAIGSQINDMAARTGVGSDALQEFIYAAKQTGAEAEDVETGIRKMSKAIFEAATGSQGARDALAAVNLTADELKGLKPEDQFKKIAAGLANISDPGARSAVAMELLGKGGAKLIPMMLELAQQTERFRSLGLGINPKDVAAADQFGDTLEDLWQQFTKIVLVVGAAVAEALQPFATAATRILRTVIDWISVNRNLVLGVLTVGLALLAAGSALVTAGLAIKGIGFALSGITSTFKFIGAGLGLLTNPVVLLVAALAALAGYFLYVSGYGGQAVDFLKTKFAELKATMSETIGGISDALSAGDIQLAAKILWTGLQLAWAQGTQELRKKWADFKSDFVKVWAAECANIQENWAETSANLQTDWVNSAAFFVDLWKKSIDKVSRFFAEDLVNTEKVREKARIDRDVASGKITAAQGAKQKANVDSQADQVLTAEKRKRDAEAIQREQETKAKLLVISEAYKRKLKQISDEELGLSAAADANAKKEVADLEAQKQDLQKQLDALRKRASDAKGEADNSTPPIVPKQKTVDTDDIAAQRLQLKPAAIGIFSPFAAQALQGQRSQVDRIAAATEKSEQWLRLLYGNGSRGNVFT